MGTRSCWAGLGGRYPNEPPAPRCSLPYLSQPARVDVGEPRGHVCCREEIQTSLTQLGFACKLARQLSHGGGITQPGACVSTAVFAHTPGHAPTPLCPVRPRRAILRGSWCPKPPSHPPRLAGGAGPQGPWRSGVRGPSACIPQHGRRQAGAAAPRSAETTRSRCWSGKDLVACTKSAPCLHQPLLGGGDAPGSPTKPFILQAQPLLPLLALAAFLEPPPKACHVWGPQTRSNILGTT